MTEVLGYLLAAAIVVVGGAFIIWVVGKLNLGMTVDGFGTAIIAALIIGVVDFVIHWLLSLVGLELNTTSIIGAIGNVIVSAVVLMVSGGFLGGMEVKGFLGAIVAAISIGVVRFIIALILATVIVVAT